MSKRWRFGDPGSYFVEGDSDAKEGDFLLISVGHNGQASCHGYVGSMQGSYTPPILRDLLKAVKLLEQVRGNLRLPDRQMVSLWLDRHTVPEPAPVKPVLISEIAALVDGIAERAGISREKLFEVLKAAEAELRKELK